MTAPASRAGIPSGTKRLLRISAFSLVAVSLSFLAVAQYFRATNDVVLRDIESTGRQIVGLSMTRSDLVSLEFRVRDLLPAALRRSALLEEGRTRTLAELDRIGRDLLERRPDESPAGLRDRLALYRDSLEGYLGDFSTLNATLEKIDRSYDRGLALLGEMEESTSRHLVEYFLAGRDTGGLQQVYTLIPFSHEQWGLVHRIVETSITRDDPGLLGAGRPPERAPEKDASVMSRLALLTATLRTMTSAERDVGDRARELLGIVARYQEGVTELDRAIRALRESREFFFSQRDGLLALLGELDAEAVSKLLALQGTVENRTGGAELAALAFSLAALAALLVSQAMIRRVGRQLERWGAETAAARDETERVNIALERENAERRQAQQDLSRARDELEDRVRERTKDLAEANSLLREEVRQRTRAEASLAEETERLDVTLRSIAEGVITTDVGGRVVMINKRAEELTGWNQREAAGREFSEVFRLAGAPQRSGTAGPVPEALKNGTIVEVAAPVTVVDRDGRRREVAEMAAPIRDRDGGVIGAVLVFRDVTERLRMEAEVLKVRKLESVGHLAGGIAHDFNNLLQGVFGYISLARLRLDQRDRCQEMLDQAEEALQQAVSLTNQLLTFSKGGRPVKVRLALPPVIENAVRLALSGSRVDCSLHFEEGLRPVEADGGQIGQVVQNIVLNAAQAMPGGGSIGVTAGNARVPSGGAPPGLAAGDYVRIEIRDCGTGITPENLPRIFDPYFTTKEKGSGLGLATSYSIVKNHGGLIEARSEPGTGSTFTVYLPAARGAEPETAAPERSRPASRRGKILVMDDERVVREVAGQLLGALGHEVGLAGDGTEAIAAYQAARDAGAPYDLVILDLTIRGGMGGVEALEGLRRIDPDVKALVSSGYSDDGAIAEHRAQGFNGFLKKPYDIGELREALAPLLR